ncbi:MAG: OmpA family protein [Rhodocyclaceae bacterium]|nr:OmpA family protein [Rhodocyclaceae bacterium]
MIKNTSKLALSAAVAATLGFASIAASAADMAPAGNTSTTGYVVDQRGLVAKSGTGLCWRTGYWTPAMANVECDPDLVAKPIVAPVVPPAPPAPPAPAPKPASKKITLSADALFDFNKATLRPEGQSKLADLAQQAQGMNLEVIIAVGHADRIGKDAYNQKLSEQRAAAVKTFLVSKGIEEKKVYTEGKGKKMPVTGNKCDKMGAENHTNKKLVDCLQPDRRVEIEVIGTTK